MEIHVHTYMYIRSMKEGEKDNPDMRYRPDKQHTDKMYMYVHVCTYIHVYMYIGYKLWMPSLESWDGELKSLYMHTREG